MVRQRCPVLNNSEKNNFLNHVQIATIALNFMEGEKGKNFDVCNVEAIS
ncbi:MAG: hypothetical protein ACTHME_04010 [Candidatus Nitrosocosmicus sp.]